MAVILVAFLLACTGSWDKVFFTAAQTCVDEGRFKEQRVHVGQQAPPYQLNCPLQPVQPEGSPRIQFTWQKDCKQIRSPLGRTFLEFANIRSEDEGNYTCTQQGNSSASFTVHLIVKELQCSKPPEFKPHSGLTTLRVNVGSSASMNCTALLLWDPSEEQCDTALRWRKDGQPLSNRTLHTQNSSSWSPGAGQLLVNSLVVVTVREVEDLGLYSCTVRNVSSDFSLESSSGPSHTAAVIAAVALLLLLAAAALVYSRCHLNIKLCYRNSFGDYELNDGKLYDAYISYVNNDYDRKFVNFILKPHLESKHGYKVHLNDNDVLPGGEPSAELIMNISRSRRLIVLLSHAYLEQDWCDNNFRQGLLQLLDLCHRPILIMLEGQSKRMRAEIKQQLSEHQHCLTILTWRHNSVTPSSAFWKELSLAMPRTLVLRSESAGDPQTVLQDDKDPMLTVDPDYLDCRSDTDPAGDLGIRLPVYRAMVCTAPVLPPAPVTLAESKSSDIDVSDLGSRNYGVRSDFYCLVAEDI